MILIDLPMPEACDVCPFNYDFCWCTAFRNNDEWEKHSDDWNDHVCDRKTRPEYCPLKEIVMCKDCVNSETSRCPCHSSGDPYIDWDPDDDWFCADGERK